MEQDVIPENYKTYLRSMVAHLKAKRCTETHMGV